MALLRSVTTLPSGRPDQHCGRAVALTSSVTTLPSERPEPVERKRVGFDKLSDHPSIRRSPQAQPMARRRAVWAEEQQRQRWRGQLPAPQPSRRPHPRPKVSRAEDRRLCRDH